MKPRIIVFAKDPQPGKVKTRLARAIGAAPAAHLYRAMVIDLANGLMRLAALTAIEIHLDTHSSFFDCFPVPKRLQQGVDLGEKLFHAMREALEEGSAAVLVLGSDSPALPLSAVEGLLAAPSDLAFGPALDGGFWGICARRVHPAMFDGVRWSSSNTLRDCLAAAAACGLSVSRGEECADLDEIEDLGKLRPEELGPRMREVMRENEAEIAAALDAAMGQGDGLRPHG